MSATIRVLVVEDDPLAAKAHAVYVERVPGFEVVAVTHSGAEAVRLVGTVGVDLVLLDMNLPDLHGTDVVRALRARGDTTDVIAVTSARDLAVVRAAVAQGIVQYLLKPFAFAALRERLDRYREYRADLLRDGAAAGQDEVDRLLATARAVDAPAPAAKGMSSESLERVVASLREAAQPRSAAEVAQAVGLSRVSARRYLEHLVATRLAARSQRLGGTGRPEVEYRWTP